MGGAALSAPSGSRRSTAVAPLPQQVLPPGLPPLPLSRAGVLPQGTHMFITLGPNVLSCRVVPNPHQIPMLDHPHQIHILNVGFVENFIMKLTAHT